MLKPPSKQQYLNIHQLLKILYEIDNFNYKYE